MWAAIKTYLYCVLTFAYFISLFLDESNCLKKCIFNRLEGKKVSRNFGFRCFKYLRLKSNCIVCKLKEMSPSERNR